MMVAHRERSEHRPTSALGTRLLNRSSRSLSLTESGKLFFERPLRHPHLYTLYVSRKHLPLKIRTFLDHQIERTRIPQPWEDPVTVAEKRTINSATRVVRLVPGK
jgi:hypothetical protein